jgi:uncharacterized membrane protein YgcG
MAETPTPPKPDEHVRQLYEEAESATGKAMERLVSREAFGQLLGMAAENTVAVIKLWADGADLVVRNLRLAGRHDLVRLAKQLARTEDKLERVLQELEELRAEQQSSRNGRSGGARGSRSRAGGSRSGGSNSGSRSGSRSSSS